MKVNSTSIAPVGFIEIFEGGAYQTGPFSVDSQTSARRAPYLEGQYEVVHRTRI